MNALQRWVARAMLATPQERAAALWSFAYFFTLLAGYYVLRPLRDQMGIAGISRPIQRCSALTGPDLVSA